MEILNFRQGDCLKVNSKLLEHRMNYKFLFPTFRNRYLFIKTQLEKYKDKSIDGALNLGTGEGDYDGLISEYCKHLIACDINKNDIEFAQKLNANVTNLEYRIEDALDLSFPENNFDLLISVEVLEHVGQPEKMVSEISRVLKPNGIAMLTFPRFNFPFTYDPINKLFRKGTQRAIAQGAYAFGHEYLINAKEFEGWCTKYGLQIVQQQNLSGSLIGLLEVYWTGIVQRVFKENSTNLDQSGKKGVKVRPSNKEPGLTFLTDGIIRLDRQLFQHSNTSIGKGYVLLKN